MKQKKGVMLRYIWQHADWTNFQWKNDSLTEILAKTRFHQGRLLGKAGSLGITLSREAQAEILIEEAVKTAEIEGQRLSRESVRSSVARRLGLPTAGLPNTDRHADGLVEMLVDATQNYDQLLTCERLKSWQAALFPTGYSGMSRIRTGEWRGDTPMQVVSGPIGREKIHFEAPPSDRITDEMKLFLEWWHDSRGKTEGLLRAGIAHFRFVTIHPFEDGNGRIARAVTDMALAQDEKLGTRFYSLSAQIMADRKAYYNVLEKSQKGDSDITEWLLWFLGCTERALKRSEKLISGVLEKAAFWQHHRETQLNDRQRKVINRLLDSGIEGFGGGLTTRKYVSMAKVSRATAYREISDLVSKGILKEAEGKGRNVKYSINYHFF